MILPGEVIKIDMDGDYIEKIYQPLIIEDGIEYDLVKTPELTLEVWFDNTSYLLNDKEYVFCSKITGDYIVVPYDKVKYQ